MGSTNSATRYHRIMDSIMDISNYHQTMESATDITRSSRPDYWFNEKELQLSSNMDINRDYYLHMHDNYEIFLFLEGDAEYIVEENTYSLEPYDMIIIRKNQLHRIHHKRPVHYHRLTFYIPPSFFRENNCLEYEAYFLNRENTSNKIPASVVLSNGLYDAFLKYKKYSKNSESNNNIPVLRSIIIEILYLINETSTFSAPAHSNTPINQVIAYLNTSYTEDISLDMLEKNFAFSKCYLCRAFRKATGLTIQRYIRIKRLAHARDLKAGGMSIGEAAMASGFRDYSSFYRAYQKEYGRSPSKDLAES